MTRHLDGVPCREPLRDFDHTTANWWNVNCSACQQTKKYERVRNANPRP